MQLLIMMMMKKMMRKRRRVSRKRRRKMIEYFLPIIVETRLSAFSPLHLLSDEEEEENEF